MRTKYCVRNGEIVDRSFTRFNVADLDPFITARWEWLIRQLADALQEPTSLRRQKLLEALRLCYLLRFAVFDSYELGPRPREACLLDMRDHYRLLYTLLPKRYALRTCRSTELVSAWSPAVAAALLADCTQRGVELTWERLSLVAIYHTGEPWWPLSSELRPTFANHIVDLLVMPPRDLRQRLVSDGLIAQRGRPRKFSARRPNHPPLPIRDIPID